MDHDVHVHDRGYDRDHDHGHDRDHGRDLDDN